MGNLKKDKSCITCGNKFRKLYNQECYLCHIKNKAKMGTRRPVNLNEALNKIYTCRVLGSKSKKHGYTLRDMISIPPILAGLKVKLVPIKKND